LFVVLVFLLLPGSLGGDLTLTAAGNSLRMNTSRRYPAQKTQSQLAAITPCVNGMAGVYPCANIDLLTFLPLSAVGGGEANDVWGWTDTLTGREYAILGRSSGTSFVDITDPQAPIFLGDLPTHTVSLIWRDVEVYSDHAFIVSEAPGHGMQVFDLRRLRNVVAPPVTFTETAHYSGFATAHTITINPQSGFAYANGSDTCGGGLHIINIQNPANPLKAGCFSGDGYTHDAQCVIYNGPDMSHRGSELCFASNVDTLTIVDVTNKAAPALVSRTGYSGWGYAHQGWLTEDHAFFLLDDEADETDPPGIDDSPSLNTRTHIWSLADLRSPQRTGIYEAATQGTDHNLFIRGNYAYESNYASGLRILDITGISSARLREVAFFDVYPADDIDHHNGTWSNYPFFPSGVVVVSAIQQGLFILRPNLSGNPMGLPNFIVSASPPSVSVRPGQSATYTLTVTPQNGFTSDISLTCPALLPARASCSLSPTAVGSGASATEVTLTLTTTAPSAQLRPENPFQPVNAALGLSLCALAVCILRAPRYATRSRLALALFLALLLLTASCGGASTSPPQPPPPPPPPLQTGTPPGTYPISVSVTAGAFRHSPVVTLVVQ